MIVKLHLFLLCLLVVSGCAPQSKSVQSESPATPIAESPAATKGRQSRLQVSHSKKDVKPQGTLIEQALAPELHIEDQELSEPMLTPIPVEPEPELTPEPKPAIDETSVVAKIDDVHIAEPEAVEPAPQEQLKPSVNEIVATEPELRQIPEIKPSQAPSEPELQIMPEFKLMPEPKLRQIPSEPEFKLTPVLKPAQTPNEPELQLMPEPIQKEVQATEPSYTQSEADDSELFTTTLTVISSSGTPLYYITDDELKSSVTHAEVADGAVIYRGTKLLDLWKPSIDGEASIDSVMELVGSVTLSDEASSYLLICSLVETESGHADYRFELLPEGSKPSSAATSSTSNTPDSAPEPETIQPRRSVVFPQRTF
ncbi:MAG: hypothetical protein ACSHX8_06985 [Opitutaceae bacterium]